MEFPLEIEFLSSEADYTEFTLFNVIKALLYDGWFPIFPWIAFPVLGSVFAKENGFDNCFLLNEKNNVVEALNGNLFIVSGKTIITPPIREGCLNGIMRKQLITIVKSDTEYSIKVEYDNETIDAVAVKTDYEFVTLNVMDLHNADEIFITNVIQGIVPVTRYNENAFEDKIAKILLQKLNDLVTTN